GEGVDRPPGGLWDGLPRRRAPREDLADPRLHQMAPVQERRPPAIVVTSERQVVSVASHAHHDRADASPGVEPGVNHEERGLAARHTDGGEGGDEKGATPVDHPGHHRGSGPSTISSGGFELPGGEALRVDVKDLDATARNELDLELRVGATHRHVADCARRATSSTSPRPLRAAGRKPSALDGRAGFLTPSVVVHRRRDDEHDRPTVYLRWDPSLTPRCPSRGSPRTRPEP